MPAIETLESLLRHELKDLFSAETQIIEALPKMIDAATSGDLRNALSEHLDVTKVQRDRLNEIQEILGEEKIETKTKGFFANLFKSNEGEEHCKAMEGLVKEGNALLSEDMSNEVMDAAIIAAVQKVEHYEISSYGTARAYALQLQLNDVAKLLEATLKEEYDANDSLTVLALSQVNLTAENATPESEKPRQKSGQKAAKKAAPKKAAPKKAAAKKANTKTKTNSSTKTAKPKNLKTSKSKK